MGYIVTADEFNEAEIGVDKSSLIENGKSYLYPSLGNMNLIGFTRGTAELQFTPVLFTNNEEFGSAIYVDGTRY